MRLIKPSFSIWDQQEGLEGVYKQIERAGRVCYKSEDKITEASAGEFVNRMIKSGHGAMLEHGTVYLKVPNSVVDEGFQFGTNWSTLCLNPYTRYISDGDYYYYTTNYRVIIEHDLQGVLEYLCEPTEYHEKRITVKFVCDRGVSHEFVRHRVFSFAQESTRYCNYSKDKFGNQVTFVIPCWFNKYMGDDYSSFDTSDWGIGLDIADAETNWLYAMLYAEKAYFSSISHGMKPQQARAVLPNSLKTELVMTGFTKDWEHFFELRDAGSAHPQARELAQPLHEEFIDRNYICN